MDVLAKRETASPITIQNANFTYEDLLQMDSI